MPYNVILHPAILAHAELLFRNFAGLSLTSQIILTALIQVKVKAREDEPLLDNLLGMMRILGSITSSIPREDLERAEAEIHNTIYQVAARERGQNEPQAVEAWFRDIS